MANPYKNVDDIKRKLRELKKLESKIHSYNLQPDKKSATYKNSSDLVWNKFFDLKNSSDKEAKYSIDELSLMTKVEFTGIINEYFYHVYYWFYKERGIADNSLINIDILTELGLPLDSAYEDVLRAFREHVKAYHPDNGGDVTKFLEIMESYNKFRTEI